ncbi:MAG: glycosyltransferase family 2 protein [Bryobacteraceae bacterium]
MPQAELGVVMPAYNEEECIAKVVVHWLATLNEQFSRDRVFMLVLNDGSKDGTGAVLDRLAADHSNLIVVHQKNSGHGATVLNGYRRAVELAPQWIFQVDSDDQFQPSDFAKVWERRAESRFITGYRRSRNDPFHRLVITRVVRLLNLAAFGCYLRDANVPYRLMETRFLKQLIDLLPGDLFAPNIFLSVLAAKAGQNPLEIAITHKERDTGVVSIVRWKLIKVCLQCAQQLVQFRLSLGQKLRSLRAETSRAAKVS